MEAIRLSSIARYDIIFMDIDLPDISGYEVVRRVRQDGINKRTTIIALTSQNAEESREKAQLVGMDGYETKPISLEIAKKIFAEPFAKSFVELKVAGGTI